MRKYIISTALLFSSTATMACGPEASIHTTHRLMNIYTADMADVALFRPRLAAHWKPYLTVDEWAACEGNVFDADCQPLVDAARRKGDTDTEAYLQLLNDYVALSNRLADRDWLYPTQDKMTLNDSVIARLRRGVEAYQGKLLRPQYVLLEMRLNMFDKRYADNIDLWRRRAKKLPASVFRDMCRNIYANALLNSGREAEAMQIYGEQCDWQSLNYLLGRNTRWDNRLVNLQALYETNADMPALPYLLQSYINSLEGREAGMLVPFVLQVIKERKTTNAAMWHTALAVLYYKQEAWKEAEETAQTAMTAKGTPEARDNARLIRLLARLGSVVQDMRERMVGSYASAHNGRATAHMDPDDCRFVATELAWLQDMAGHAVWEIYDEDESSSGFKLPEGYYNHMLDVVLRDKLATCFRMMRRKDLIVAIEAYAADTSGYLAEALQQMPATADDLMAYSALVEGNATDDMERFFATNIRSDLYPHLYDVIGTRLMAEGRFEEAIPYLEKVPVDVVRRQAAAFYMARRDYTKDLWFERQKINEETLWEAASEPMLDTNPRLTYCREMVSLQSQYRLANDKARPEIAYRLASRYFQASNCGDCWYLTRHTLSRWSSPRGEGRLSPEALDFVRKAWTLLAEAAQTSDLALKGRALYARAFCLMKRSEIDIDGGYIYVWDVTNRVKEGWNFVWKGINLTAITGDEDPYDDLATFYMKHNKGDKLMPYATRCDILQQYIKTRR